ncbi:uncharacterized protein NP_4824A [Natronomonas pharaonis DSM 2160]|uniref:Uncharacterized protein n=1 Tax=Natronomonas pharaonis (strain ATCC 35678 / DSM 2160 / CIP 103997 / JCM 8858 / NBRC 14720 / NCIMB 2260 / Gabara) TaxID=348780 RepID=A0A1U7EZ01_NATPD|nr:uncharacterized protein NP_4824A [Natronomonas pharaonis DSM 2160]
MYDARTRAAVARYVRGLSTAREAAREADISTAELRHYARTCGIAPAFTGDEHVDSADSERAAGTESERDDDTKCSND